MEPFFEQINVIEPNALVAFGLLLLCGVLGGLIANRLSWLPTITAFMVLGFIFGPQGLNLFSDKMLEGAKILNEIALGLILYKLGNMIHPAQMLRSKRLMLTAFSESGLTFFLIVLVMRLFGYDFSIAMMVGAIAISSSPAVLVHVSEELGADGPNTDHAKSLVAINNLLSFIVFTICFPFALSSQETGLVSALLLPLYRLAVATVIGAGAAWIAVQIAKRLKHHDEHYRFAVIIGSVILALGVSKMVHASTLFSTLSLGIATRWFEKRRFKLSHLGLSEGGDLFYIVLFVMAGAKININALVATGVLPILLVIARIAGKFLGIHAVRKAVNTEKTQCTPLALLLIPMAGMAIGLTSTLQTFVPVLGEQVAAIIFAMIATFETIGPFAAVKAFRMSGEIPAEEEEKDPEEAPQPTPLSAG